MQIVRDLAGFTLAEADILRKAIGKKIKSLLEEQKKIFVERMVKNNIEKSVARQLGGLLEPFARYGFNRSHAASYALVAYQTAYLKTAYPIEFMTALLNADEKDIERIGFLIKEARLHGIEVLPPELNASFDGFSPEDAPASGEDDKADKNKQAKTIRFGLRAIKNVGSNAVRSIIKERAESGPFTSLENFLDRIPPADINKKTLEALIKSGSLDKFGERAGLLENVETLLTYQRESARALKGGQSTLFSGGESTALPPLRLKETEPVSQEEKLKWEKELLGLFVSGHPLDKFKDILERQPINIKNIKTMKEGTPVLIGGLIEELKKVLTKKNEPMLFLKLADFTDNIEAVVFPRLLAANGGIFQPDRCIAIKGSVSLRNGTPSIICNEAKILGEKKID